MIIKEAAEFLTATTGQTVTSKKLISQLQAKFPAQSFNENSEVPEAFVEQIEKIVEDKKVTEPIATISKADPKNAMEAIKDSHQSSDLIMECISQALQDEAIAYTINKAAADAFKLLDVYNATQERVFENALSNQIGDIQAKIEDVRAENENYMIQSAIQKGERLGKLAILRDKSRQRLQATEAYLETILKAL